MANCCILIALLTRKIINFLDADIYSTIARLIGFSMILCGCAVLIYGFSTSFIWQESERSR